MLYEELQLNETRILRFLLSSLTVKVIDSAARIVLYLELLRFPGIKKEETKQTKSTR